MLTPDRFLTAARTLLGVRVHDESVRTAEQIGRRSVDGSEGTPVERYWRDYLSDSRRRFIVLRLLSSSSVAGLHARRHRG
jgi:hypothetical protein